MRRNCWMACGLVCLLAWFSASAFAAPETPTEDGYEVVSGDMMQKGETIPGGRMAAIAYGFVFATVALYGLGLMISVKRLEIEINELKKKIAS